MNIHIKAFLILVLVMHCFKINSQQPFERIRTLIDSIYKVSQIPGFAVAVVDADGIKFQNAFGFADLQEKTPFTVETTTNIASVTKSFMGVILMKLVEQEKLTLDTPINQILPFKVLNARFPEKEITIRHLATHTSGIQDDEMGYHRVFLNEDVAIKRLKVSRETKRFFRKWKKNDEMDLDYFLRASMIHNGALYTRKRFTKQAPGEEYLYSNLGASLLGYCIEIASGKSLQELVNNEIIDPLNLKSTFWDLKHQDQKLSEMYFENLTIVPEYKSITYPAGGLNSSCADLAIYLSKVISTYQGNADLLSPIAARELFAPALTEEHFAKPGKKNQAIMWEINGNKIGHHGSNYGVTVLMDFDKVTGRGRIFICNISTYQSGELLTRMIEIFSLLDQLVV